MIIKFEESYTYIPSVYFWTILLCILISCTKLHSVFGSMTWKQFIHEEILCIKIITVVIVSPNTKSRWRINAFEHYWNGKYQMDKKLDFFDLFLCAQASEAKNVHQFHRMCSILYCSFDRIAVCFYQCSIWAVFPFKIQYNFSIVNRRWNLLLIGSTNCKFTVVIM